MRWFGLVLVVALAAGGYVFGWAPRAAAKQLRVAALAGDVEALQELVDFPAVRENLKADLKGSMAATVGKAGSSRFGEAVALGMGALFVDGLVDQVASPSGIAAIARGVGPGAASDVSIDEGTDTAVVAVMRNDGLSRFRVSVVRPGAVAGDSVALVFSRRGIDWQLTRVGIAGQGR